MIIISLITITNIFILTLTRIPLFEWLQRNQVQPSLVPALTPLGFQKQSLASQVWVRLEEEYRRSQGHLWQTDCILGTINCQMIEEDGRESRLVKVRYGSSQGHLCTKL